MADPLDPSRSFGYQVRATHRAFDRLLQRYLSRHGLPNGFWYVLRVLWRHEGMTQRELAAAVNLAESSNVLMLERMEKAGLVKRRRDNADRRRIRVHLTRKARLLEAQLMPVVRDVNAVASAGIADKDLAVFLRVSHTMQRNLRAVLEAEAS
jgi:DNA-binding MarR family transcriptional regulator